MAFNSGVYDPHRKPDKVTENKKREKDRQEFFHELSEANPNGKPFFEKGERPFSLAHTKSVGRSYNSKKTNKKKTLNKKASPRKQPAVDSKTNRVGPSRPEAGKEMSNEVRAKEPAKKIKVRGPSDPVPLTQDEMARRLEALKAHFAR